MTFSQKDFAKLQIPLLSMLVMLVLAGLLAWWSTGLAEKSERENKAANASKKARLDKMMSQAVAAAAAAAAA